MLTYSKISKSQGVLKEIIIVHTINHGRKPHKAWTKQQGSLTFFLFFENLYKNKSQQIEVDKCITNACLKLGINGNTKDGTYHLLAHSSYNH